MTAATPTNERQSSLPGEGEVLAGKYRVNGILGEGGMGIVVAAHHLELDQPVAIKVLHENASNYAESTERFRREARVAAKIQSDHVTRILDVGELPNGARYMVMEFLDGQDLGAELAQRGSFAVGMACALMLEALDALERAHAVGIVHRDIKPENLFLTRRPDGSLRLKVLDFGISKQMGEPEQLSLTKTSEWIGTPLYMSPEQMESPRLADARSDIWSLGAVLYELISGKPPYEAESLPQLCSLLLTREPVDIRSQRPGIPDELAEVIMGCLKRDVSVRIQSAAVLAQALAQFATVITGSGMRPSMLARTELGSSTITTSQVRVLDAQSLAPRETTRLKRTSTHPFTSQTLTVPAVENRSLLRTSIPLLGAALVLGSAVFFFTRMSIVQGDSPPPSADAMIAAAPVVLSGPSASPSEAELEVATQSARATTPQVQLQQTAAQVGTQQPQTSQSSPSPAPALPPAKAKRPSGSSQSGQSPTTPTIVDEFADFGGRR